MLFACLPTIWGALQFDGVNDYVTFGPAPGLGVSNFTVEVWFKRVGVGVAATSGSSGISDSLPLLTKGRGEADGDNRDMNFHLGLSTNNNVLAADFEEGIGGNPLGQNHPVYGVTSIADQVWNHAAVSFDGSKWQLFLNGTLERELTVGRLPRWDSIQHAALGSAVDSTGTAAGYFQGILDEARVWNYARSASQIASNRHVRIASAPGLIGRWPLDESSGSTARDTSGSGINGLLTNGPVWVAGYPFQAAPSVVLTNPPDHATFTAPTNILLTADAADLDGTVTNVAFFNGTNWLGDATTSPFGLVWSNATLGSYQLKAVATDNAGLAATSAPVVITVLNRIISITSPTNNAALSLPADVAIDALASDADGLITKVEFYQAATKLGEAISRPFSCTWSNMPAGDYLLTAVSTDSGGIMNTSAPVAVTLFSNLPPSVSLTSPAGNASFTVPTNFTISASASDPDGTVVRVEFLANNLKLGEDTSSPFGFAWSNATPGIHFLSAIATDNRGLKATSAPVLISCVRQTTLIATGSVWKYLDNGSDQGTAWRTPGFNDSAWGSGPGQLGYGENDEATVVSYGPDANNRYVTTYFRRAFTVTGAVTFTNLTLRLLRDDGAVVFLNGLEAGRMNMPAGTITNRTLASSAVGSTDETTFFPTNLNPALLVEGTNIIAVEIHQSALNSSDISFDLELAGTQCAVGAAVVSPTNGALNVGRSPALTAAVADATGDDLTVTFYGRPFPSGNFTAIQTNFAVPSGANTAATWPGLASSTSYEWFVRVSDGIQVVTNPAAMFTTAGNFAPSISLASPTNLSVLAGPTNLALLADASDSDGAVSKVEFFQGTNKLGEATSAPFAFTWTNASPGYNILTAMATDDTGGTATSSPVLVTIHNAVIRLASPTNNAAFVSPADIAITAVVTDSNSPITRVDFFAGTTKLGEAADVPYALTWTNASAGTHALTAVAAANGGILHTSLPVSISVAANVAPSIALTAPTNNTIFTLPCDVVLNALATDSDGTVARVEFFQGATKLGEDSTAPYSLTWTNPGAGIYTLRAVATDDRGATATSAVVNITVASASVTRGPYLQSATTSGITIRWRTSAPTDTRVWHGITPDALASVTSDSAATNEHSLSLTGLEPDTRYYYAIGTSQGPIMSSSNLWFSTLPIPGTDKPTRIWALSDVGYGGTAAASVRNAYTNFTGTRGTDVVLTLGDNEQHTGLDADYQTYFFNVWSGQMKNLVFWTTLGNHDAMTSSTPGPFPYFDIFSMPANGQSGGVASGTENYYSFDYGRVHFLSIDSVAASHATNSAMANWIRADLLVNTQPWVIAYWHYPPYSMGSHNSDTELGMKEMRQNIVPILEAGGVDLVLSGHTHVYERSYLMNGHYGLMSTFAPEMKNDGGDGRTNGTGAYLKPPGQKGTVYVVAAVSSAAGGFVGTHPAMYARIGSTLGSSVLDVSCDRLDYRFLDSSGAVRDNFTILKGNSQLAPPAVPASFLATTITSNKIALSWANNATNEASYSLERSLDGLNFVSLATIGANLTTYTNASLPTSTQYFYRLRAWNNAGYSDFTPVATATTPALSVPPVVAITSPASGASFIGPANFTFTATASDIDGSVTNVEFFLNATRVGADASSPYAFTTNGLACGLWTLAAVAWDNLGVSSTSAPVTFTVASATLTRGPYVQLVTTNSAVVRWRTSTAGDSVLRCGLSAGSLSNVVTDAASTTEHIMTVSNLPPDTTWFYAVGTTAGNATFDTNCFFTTAPLTGTAKPVRVWVLGDPGTKDDYQRATRDAYTNFAAGRRADLVLTLGDTDQDNATDAEYQQSIFNIYPALLRNTPFWPAIGNHDTYTSNALPYLNAFTLPTNGVAGGVSSGSELYYSFDFANVHFICLESQMSDRATNGPMLTWLRQDLAANRQPWTIAYWHHPPYSKGDHDSDTDPRQTQMRQNAAPMLEAAGVDLVLNGHCHVYERTFLLNGHYGLSTTFNGTNKLDGGDGRTNGTGAYLKSAIVAGNQGTVYVEAGVSGEVVSWGSLNHPAVLVGQRTYGSLVIDVESNRLDCRLINTNAGVADHFTIIKGQAMPPDAPLNLAASPLASDTIRLLWDNTPTNEMGFKLERSTNGIDFAQIAAVGANLTAFTNTGLASSTPYFYRIRAWNDAGDSAWSSLASVSTPGLPRIVVQPQSTTNLAGSAVIFSILAGGTTPLSYQWRRAGNSLAGQTSATLSLVDVQSGDAGNYTVVVSNTVGSVTSAVATLTINRPPVPGSLLVGRLPFSGVKLRKSAVLGADADGDPVSLVSVGPGTAQGGTVFTNANWIFYRPPSGFTNGDSFNFTVTDGRGGTGSGTITVSVTNDNSAVPAVDSQDFRDDALRLRFSAIPNEIYAVQFCENPLSPDWQTLGSAPANYFGILEYLDRPPKESPPRHYRITPTQP